jgi:teichuronic acid biosynthesis glycosyltransferase TuaH
MSFGVVVIWVSQADEDSPVDSVEKIRMRSTETVDPHVIWISGQRWDQDGGTHRQMATALSAYARILWVDPPASPVTRSYKAHTIKPELTDVTDRIVRLTPVVLPGFTRLGVRATTPMLVRRQVRWAVRKLGFQPNAVVMLYLGGVLGSWGEGVTNVMYGTDNYVAGAELMGVSARHLRRLERQALSNADIVVALSPELAGRWAGMGAKPIVIPNGCWPILDTDVRHHAKEIDLPRPVAGLIGRLSDRINFDVLEAIADSGQSLLLMGPRDPRWEPERFRRLTSKLSVRYIGPVSNADVPAHLAGIDVGITPYKDNAFNRASFPLKTLEYLSVGLPVVTTSLPTMRWLREDLEETMAAEQADQILMLADDDMEWVNAIKAMAAVDEKATGLRIAFADRHSWHKRAEQLATEIGLLPIASSGGEYQ